MVPPLPLVKGVKSLQPGHWVRLGESGESERRVFWQIERVDVPRDYETATEYYGELLLENIRAHVEGSAAGVFLSGGSDSAAVVGALHRLCVETVVAAHMEVGNCPTEDRDVEALRDTYDFNLLKVAAPLDDVAWADEVKHSIVRNQPGPYPSFPMYARMGRRLASALPTSATVFNGEMCLLDQGFTVVNDRLRNLRRWLYTGGGRYLASFGPLLPERAAPNWNRIWRTSLDRQSRKDQAWVLANVIRSFFYALGRPAAYYGGMKLGFSQFPGFTFLTSYLPGDYPVNLEAIFKTEFFDGYSDRLLGDEWRQALATMTTCWYAESSNFTMPLDAAAAGARPICFPFSSVALMDYASSLPRAWTIDKKIQKDMCANLLGMPPAVAYRPKDHRETVRYVEAVYGDNWSIMQDRVRENDYGPLQSGIDTFIASGRQIDDRWFALYALAQLMEEYGMAIR